MADFYSLPTIPVVARTRAARRMHVRRDRSSARDRRRRAAGAAVKPVIARAYAVGVCRVAGVVHSDSNHTYMLIESMLNEWAAASGVRHPDAHRMLPATRSGIGHLSSCAAA